MDGKKQNNGASPIFLRMLTDSQAALFTHLCVLMAGNTENARDVLQETNLYLMQCSGTYDATKSSFLTWAKAMAALQAMKFRKQALREKKRMVYSEEVYDEISSRLAEEPEPPNDRLYALRLCLQRLKAKDRRLLDLHYKERKLFSDLSQEFHIGISALKIKFMRLRNALAKCISGTLCDMAEGKEELPDTEDPFELLLSDALNGELSAASEGAFNAALKENPARIETCIKQMTLHALLACKADAELAAAAHSRRSFFRHLRQSAGIAATLGLLLAGGYAGKRFFPRPTAPAHAEAPRPAVQVAAVSRPTAPATAAQEQELAPRAAIAALPPAPAKQVQSALVCLTNQQIAVAKPQVKEKKQSMNTASIRSKALVTAAAATAALAVAKPEQTLAESIASVPIVSNVTFRQPFGTRTLEIGYTLSNGPGIVTVDITTNGVSIGGENVTYLSGEVNKVVSNGTYTVLWDTKKAWPDHTNEQARAVVTAWATACPPQYAAVDISGGTNSTAAYTMHYYPSAEAVDGGVTNDIYKTTWLLFRKIERTGSQGFTMGSPATELGRKATRELQHTVVLTHDFYMAVYPTTQEQWLRIMGTKPSYYYGGDKVTSALQRYCRMRPVETVSYNDIRGTATIGGDYDWPNDRTNVLATSFMGRLRTKTGGVLRFDLPTDAQYEYACRAGTVGAWNNGTDITNILTDANLALLGRYSGNGGLSGTSEYPANCETTFASPIVGSYLPNAWGLYDMHGCIWEWCLDWIKKATDQNLVDAVDPVGQETGSNRIERGGSWRFTSEYCRSAQKGSDPPVQVSNGVGFRVSVTLD